MDNNMSDKEDVLELVKRLPSEISMRDILEEIEFVAAVKEGLNEIDQGKGVTIDAVEKMMEA
jgi:predicted transcriptional regulator